MPTKRRPISRPSRRLPDAIERLLNGLEIENTKENKSELVSVVYFRDYADVIDDDTRQRASRILWEWAAPEWAARREAELALQAEMIRKK